MNKSTILNKLKLLDIHKPWLVSVVKELSRRRGSSANMEPLQKDVLKRMKAANNAYEKKKFQNAVTKLLEFDLVYEKKTISGNRLHLLGPVWNLEDAIIHSISRATLECSRGRRTSINWKTILKDVRKELAKHQMKLPYKVTETLVRYFLLRNCGWKTDIDNDLVASMKIRKKLPTPQEHQPDLFS